LAQALGLEFLAGELAPADVALRAIDRSQLPLVLPRAGPEGDAPLRREEVTRLPPGALFSRASWTCFTSEPRNGFAVLDKPAREEHAPRTGAGGRRRPLRSVV